MMGTDESEDGVDPSPLPPELLKAIHRCESTTHEFDRKATEAVAELDRQIQDPRGSGPDWDAADNSVTRAAAEARADLVTELIALKAIPIAPAERESSLLRDSYVAYVDAWLEYLEAVEASPDLASRPETKETVAATFRSVPWETVPPPEAEAQIDEPQSQEHAPELEPEPEPEDAEATSSHAEPSGQTQNGPPSTDSDLGEVQPVAPQLEASDQSQVDPLPAAEGPKMNPATDPSAADFRPEATPIRSPLVSATNTTLEGVAKARSFVGIVALLIAVLGVMWVIGVIAGGPEVPTIASDPNGIRITDPQPAWEIRIFLAATGALITAFVCAFLVGLWGLLHSHVRLLEFAENQWDG